jgi:hypothetical protein
VFGGDASAALDSAMRATGGAVASLYCKARRSHQHGEALVRGFSRSKLLAIMHRDPPLLFDNTHQHSR